MRLIDIDKHFKLNEAFYRADIEMPLHRVKYALESLPTVEAIPIAWLKRVNSLCGQETRLQEAIDLWESKERENGSNSKYKIR